VSDIVDYDLLRLCVNFVYNPIVPYPDAEEPLSTRQFDHLVWKGIRSQILDLPHYARYNGSRKSLQVFLYRWLEINAIEVHYLSAGVSFLSS
jgi:hypothetical protein